jgi:hypothetical protein
MVLPRTCESVPMQILMARFCSLKLFKTFSTASDIGTSIIVPEYVFHAIHVF